MKKKESFDLLFLEGRRQLHKRRYKRAINLFQCALSINRSDKELYKHLADALFCLGYVKEAKEALLLYLPKGYIALPLKEAKIPSRLFLKKIYLETTLFLPIEKRVIYNVDLITRNINNHPLSIANKNHYHLFALPPPCTHIPQPALLLGGDSNYFQWMVNIFPKLKRLFQHPTLQKLPLVVNSDLKPFQIDSLKMVGIDKKQLLPLKNGRLYSFEILHLIPNKNLTHKVHWVRKMLPIKELKSGAEKIFLFRGKADRRVLLNEEEIFQKLLPYGFVKCEPKNLSLQEQIDTFASAKQIVATHDAGLTNILFCQPGCKIIELSHINNPMKNFKKLANIFQLDYQNVLGAPTTIGECPYHNQMADFTIDCNLVLKALKKMD